MLMRAVMNTVSSKATSSAFEFYFCQVAAKNILYS